MDPSVGSFAQVALIIVLLTASCSAIIVGLVRGVQKKSSPPRISDAENLQLAQLQQSVDAIAVEVERIAEAQRFSAKLLADRAEPAALKRASST